MLALCDLLITSKPAILSPQRRIRDSRPASPHFALGNSHVTQRFFCKAESIVCAFFAAGCGKPLATVKSERGLRSPGKPDGFLAGQQALHYGGSELLVRLLRPVRRFPYVEEVGGKNLELVPQHLVECG